MYILFFVFLTLSYTNNAMVTGNSDDTIQNNTIIDPSLLFTEEELTTLPDVDLSSIIRARTVKTDPDSGRQGPKNTHKKKDCPLRKKKSYGSSKIQVFDNAGDDPYAHMRIIDKFFFYAHYVIVNLITREVVMGIS